MSEPNPFGQFATPTPANVTTPAPVTVAPTQNPATVSSSAADQAAAFAAWQAQQQAAVIAPPAAPVDPQQAAFLAWQAQQQAAPVVAAPTPQFVQPAAPAGSAPSGGTDPFDDPAPPRPRGPRLQEMAGRLLLIIPKALEKRWVTDPKTQERKEQERMTADVVVLDGGPIAFGGKPEGRPPTQHDQVGQIPFRNAAMYISAVGLVSQSRVQWEKRQRGEPGMVIGRLGYGEQTNKEYSAPWILEKATDADKALARQYLATIDPFA